MHGTRQVWTGGRYLALVGGLAAVGVACGPRPEPEIPVYASPVDLTLLAGEWTGEYSSRDGRRGHIVFRLEPGTSTARGEVFMFPEIARSRETKPLAAYGERSIDSRPDPEPIAVEFVWTESGLVQGRLAPYRDPELEATLEAEFRGAWRGEVIEGRFASREGGRIVREGWWRAVRTGTLVEGAPLKGGPDEPTYAELVALGRRVFESRGCMSCHAAEGAAEERARDGREADAPELDAVTRHRTFPWIYHMVVHPDSMLRADPTARDLMRGYETRMRDLDLTPWEALVLYEYLVQRAIDRPADEPAERPDDAR